MDKALIAVGVALLLAACATTPISIGLPCTVGPILLDKNDDLTRSTAEQIVTLNESGEKLCRWEAPKK
jgi:starvation-inducible outer membrane lipoprotein